MARPRPQQVARRAPTFEEMQNFTSEDLHHIMVHTPGNVVTSDSPTPWHSSPRFMLMARSILQARGER